MEFVKFNRVAPMVVDAPESIRTESNYGKIALEDFDEITTYSRWSGYSYLGLQRRFHQ
jgi:hypothetical protein